MVWVSCRGSFHPKSAWTFSTSSKKKRKTGFIGKSKKIDTIIDFFLNHLSTVHWVWTYKIYIGYPLPLLTEPIGTNVLVNTCYDILRMMRVIYQKSWARQWDHRGGNHGCDDAKESKSVRTMMHLNWESLWWKTFGWAWKFGRGCFESPAE